MESQTLRLTTLGYRIAGMLFDSALDEDALRRVALRIAKHLPDQADIIQISLFLREQGGLFREIVDIHAGQMFLDAHYVSEQQLPKALLDSRDLVLIQHGPRHELWIPLVGNDLDGFLIWVSRRAIDDAWMAGLKGFQHTISLGFRHHLTMRQTMAKLKLLQATTDLSHLVASSDSTEQILFNLADAGVRVLAFDRATLFLFDGITAAVTRTIYADIGTSPVQLPVTPEPPTRAQHTTHLPTFPAIWAPIMVEGRLTGGLLLDNLYSRDPIPDGALQAVMDLCTQVVIALQKANLVEQLNAKARHDDLTGLCRVEHFYHVADDILSRGEDDLTASGLMMMDIDYFKQVNDSYGHPAGDSVLINTAQVIRDCIPNDAIAGRIGGDEFVILIPNVTLEDCKRIGKQLIDRFSATNFAFLSPTHHRLSISLGVSVFPRDGRSVSELIQAADRALYLSKRNGRAQVSLSSDVFTA